MLKNYFKIAFRQMRRQKMYAAVKIGGFALGVAACLLIGLYIMHETSYDSFYPDDAQLYRVYGEYNDNGKIDKGTSFPAPMDKALKSDFPEILMSARLMPNSLFDGAGSNELRRSDQVENTYEEGFTYADPDLLQILGVHMVYGNVKTALNQPQSMVITKRKADKYFPGQNPVGKVMYLNNDKTKPYTVGGVMDDYASNTLLQYDFLLTLVGREFYKGEQTNWDASNYESYIKLRPGTDIASFEKRASKDVVTNYILPTMIKDGVKDANKIVNKASVHLQPVKDIHLRSYDIGDYFTNHGDMRFIWLFGAIAGFILVIACINFVNLSTAKSANRAKEVGLRKAVGSMRGSLIGQFLAESIVYSFLSFFLGLIFAIVLLPSFNMLASTTLSVPWTTWWLLPVIIVAAFIVGVIAGIYPAFYLSAFKPALVLKGSISNGSKSSVLRNSLVVFQFTSSIILIICTIVIYSQMKYILNKDVGFSKDQVVMIQGTNTMGDAVKSFKTDLTKLASVKSVSISDYLPVNGTKRNGNEFHNEGKEHEEAGVGAQMWQVDNDYLQTLGIKLVAGRNFTPGMSTDSNAVIINETMAKSLGIKNITGKRITNGWLYPVIGIVKDFNFESMRGTVGGLVLHWGMSPSIVSVKVSGADMKNTLANISAVWRKYSPSQPIRYTFLDAQFAKMYADVEQTGYIFTSFAILAIIIACLGLFALAAFMAEQRSKEIGIRKVLGASVSNVTTMLSIDFIKLVILSIIIASPIAWWAMNKWLQDFSYRTTITWWMFAFAALASILIAIITVSYQSIKAAVANPVVSLRSE